MKRVEFYYDLVSPYSYLARGEIFRICRERETDLELKPMLLGAVHNAVGLQAPIEIRPKARYQTRDIRRWAEHYGLQMDFPEPFPFRTLKTMRAAMFLGRREDWKISPGRRSPCTGRKAGRQRGWKRPTRTARSPRSRAASAPTPERS